MTTFSTLQTWDDSSFFRQGYIVLTDKENPYKNLSLEGELVNYIMSLDGTYIMANSLTMLGKNLLKYLISKNVSIDLDTWSFYNLMDRSLWLSLNAGVIKIEKRNVSPVPQYAIYLQSGLLDLFHEPSYLNELTSKAPNQEKLIHLQKVALIASELKKIWKLPIMKIDGDKIAISNYESWLFSRSEKIPLPSLPIQPWNFSSKNEVNANTRGLFHHLGDEMAFICAAIQYGDCYVVGSDEFGDLIVLGVIQFKNSQYSLYKLGGIYSSMDFDYIYSVSGTNSFYPATRNSFFNFSSDYRDQCKINDKNNSTLSDKYWNNSYFLSHAQRDIKEVTVSQFNEKLINCIKNMMSESDFMIYEKILEEDYTSILDEIKKLNLEPIVLKKYTSTIFSYITNFLDSTNTQTIENLKQNIASTSEHEINILNYIEMFKKHLYTMKNFCIKYNQEFENNFSFFYKTVAHKVHCDIMNPKKIEHSGFFLKDGNTLSIQKFNLSDIFIELFSCLKNYNKDNVVKSTQIFNTLHKNALKKNIGKQMSIEYNPIDIINYWDEANIPAFVLSDIVDMQNEYRVFVINNRPVAASPCFRNTTPFNAWDNGRFDPRLCDGHSANDYYMNEYTRSRVASYAWFAKKFAREIGQQFPNNKNFVLDLAYSKDANNGLGGVIPIEINSISLSGAYQTDLRRMCAAIAKKAYYKSDMNSYGDYAKLLSQSTIDIPKNSIEIQTDYESNELLRELTMKVEKKEL